MKEWNQVSMAGNLPDSVVESFNKTDLFFDY